MVIENKYLRKAIKKAGYVVIVKNYNMTDKSSKLSYISPNAVMLGMNVEMLNKGMKLTEDYIFPEDRQKVISTIYNAIEAKVSDYVHEYRMVGDDGKLYKVTNEICIAEESDNMVVVECYIRNASDETADTKEDDNHKQHMAADHKPVAADKAPDMAKLDTRLEELMNTVAKLSGLYSVFVSIDGKVVFNPTGPAVNLGDFFDLFEKPSYKEYYKYIKQVMLEKNEPVILEREEGGLGKISAAPIYLDDMISGFWILGSYTEEETAKLKEISESQWKIAKFFSEYLRKSKAIEVEVAKSRGAGQKLREELARQNIINNALSKINSKINESIDQVIDETIREVGVHLDVNKVFLYTFGKSQDKDYTLRSYWDVSGEAPDDELLYTLPERMFVVRDGIRRGEGRYFVDNTNMTHDAKINIMRYNFKAVIVYPIYVNERPYGALFFAECKTERVWTKEELRFSESISLLIQNMLENAEGDDNVRNVNKHLIETYNSFNVGIFVRDARSGKVLFSNDKMNEILGYNFTGGDSRVILTDLHDRFDNITGMRKPFITKEKVTNWRSYIKALDDIMDITEIQIEWLNGEQASLIILRRANDL